MRTPIYTGIPEAERNTVASTRSYFKRRGLVLAPLRAQLIHMAVQVCQTALRRLTPAEQRAVLRYLGRYATRRRIGG